MCFFAIGIVLFNLWRYSNCESAGCPEISFIPCLAQLNARSVPFDTNVLNLVFNIQDKVSLLQICKGYMDVVPCFREKVTTCGDMKQKQALAEVGKMLKFLCTPDSEHQKTFLLHVGCIQQALKKFASESHKCQNITETLHQVEEQQNDTCAIHEKLTCAMKIWLSNQNLCALKSIESNCGFEASIFYTKLQNEVFSVHSSNGQATTTTTIGKFPIIPCDDDCGVVTTGRNVKLTSYSKNLVNNWENNNNNWKRAENNEDAGGNKFMKMVERLFLNSDSLETVLQILTDKMLQKVGNSIQTGRITDLVPYLSYSTMTKYANFVTFLLPMMICILMSFYYS